LQFIINKHKQVREISKEKTCERFINFLFKINKNQQLVKQRKGIYDIVTTFLKTPTGIN